MAPQNHTFLERTRCVWVVAAALFLVYVGYAAHSLTEVQTKAHKHVALPRPLDFLPVADHFSIVLPVDLSNKERFTADFVRNCFRSFWYNFEISKVIDWWIIVPPSQVEEAKMLALDMCTKESVCLPVRVLSEKKLLPPGSLNGWQAQQLLKLSAAEIVRTEYYMVIDADTLCMQRTAIADLFEPPAELRTQDIDTDRIPQRRRALNGMVQPFSHPNWLHFSALTLKLPEPDPKELYIGVTPQTLKRSICLGLAVHLTNLYNIDWKAQLRKPMQFLKNGRWTEFTLYYLFAKSTKVGDSNLWEQYHARGDLIKTPLIRQYQFETWDFDATMKEPGYFFYVQSSQHIPAKTVWERIQPYMPSDPHFPTMKGQSLAAYDGAALLE
eukprot:m.67089 g.67089  ORF g.67089 m.67089 type:complete len:383 (+) comp19775_c0_seq2:28-1176(+)